MKKKALSERHSCTEFITPAVAAAGLDMQRQIHQNIAALQCLLQTTLTVPLGGTA